LDVAAIGNLIGSFMSCLTAVNSSR